jgi:hypothetical protein
MVARRVLLLVVVMAVGCLGLASQASADLYWANPAPCAIASASLDGSHVVPNRIGGADVPRDVAVGGGYVYWTNAGAGTIGRARLDGSEVDQHFIDTMTSAYGIAVANGYVYWGAGIGIGRARLDGTDVMPRLINTGRDAARALAVDGRYIYWASDRGGISRSDLNGFQIQPTWLATPAPAMALAVDGAHLYWADGRDAIGRTNRDGTGFDPEFIRGAGDPIGLAVDDWQIYWSNNRGGTIGRAKPRRDGRRARLHHRRELPVGHRCRPHHLRSALGDEPRVRRAAARHHRRGADPEHPEPRLDAPVDRRRTDHGRRRRRLPGHCAGLHAGAARGRRHLHRAPPFRPRRERGAQRGAHLGR